MAGTAGNGLFVRLYVDADISYKLAQVLRGRGFDAVAAREVGMAEASDDEQMAYAAAEGRAILTCNAQDFTPIFRDYWRSQRSHSGVIVSEQLGFGEMLRRAIQFLNEVVVPWVHITAGSVGDRPEQVRVHITAGSVGDRPEQVRVHITAGSVGDRPEQVIDSGA